jgi:hypothetical protein
VKITDASTSTTSSVQCTPPDDSVCSSTPSQDSDCLESASSGADDDSNSDLDEMELGDFLRDAFEGFDPVEADPCDICT